MKQDKKLISKKIYILRFCGQVGSNMISDNAINNNSLVCKLNYKKFSLISPQIFNIVYVYLVFIRHYDKKFVIDKMFNYVQDNKNKYQKECQLEYEQEVLEIKRTALYLQEQKKIEDERLAREERIRKMLNENTTF